MSKNTIYHVFTDGQDHYVDTRKEANQIYRNLCQDHDRVRMYKEEEIDQDFEENYVKGKGDFPY